MSNLERLKDCIIEALNDNLVCILLTGSRIRGEEREDSDYDLAIIIVKIDEVVIAQLQSVFSDLTNYSVYLLDEEDLKTLPKAQFLQFIYSKKLYGDFDYSLPTRIDVTNYVEAIRRDWLDRIRHYLVIPHSQERRAKALLPALKMVYLTLSYLIYGKTGNLPRTRRDTIAFLGQKEDNTLGINLMEILEGWKSSKEKHLANPEQLLLQLEAFFRTIEI
jgi:predicted nucleotidyltransferase